MVKDITMLKPIQDYHFFQSRKKGQKNDPIRQKCLIQFIRYYHTVRNSFDKRIRVFTGEKCFGKELQSIKFPKNAWLKCNQFVSKELCLYLIRLEDPIKHFSSFKVTMFLKFLGAFIRILFMAKLIPTKYNTTIFY